MNEIIIPQDQGHMICWRKCCIQSRQGCFAWVTFSVFIISMNERDGKRYCAINIAYGGRNMESTILEQSFV